MSNGARLRLAVFDCDGTLVDSQHSIVEAMTLAWRGRGRADPAPEDVRRIIGLPLVGAIAALAPDVQASEHLALAELYKDAFHEQRRRADLAEPLFPGAREALAAIEAAGYLLGIATGKGRRGLDAILDRHKLAGRFVTLQTSDTGPGKPHPAMLRRAMAEAGAAPADTAMIGDTSFDIEMARAAGVAGIGVAWGYHPAEELKAVGAATVIADFAELPPTLARLVGRTAGR